MRPALQDLPKVELHVHLEGTIAAETAIALARQRSEEPEEVLPLVDGGYPPRFESFAAFVDLYQAVSRQVRDPDDLAVVAGAFARRQAAQNVIYTEVTFTAATHLRNGMNEDAMWQALTAGFAEAPEIGISLIVDTIRDLGPDFAGETIRAVERADAPIVGLGLTGTEGSEPERNFRMLREAANGLGLGLAVHAGETGTPENVRAALDHLQADRIGHGVAAVRDAALTRRLIEAQTPIEVCPSSNVRLGIFDSLADHPFGGMYDAGLNVTVNSDDPPFFGTTLSNELDIAMRLAGLDHGAVVDLQRRAVLAAFLGGSERAHLLARIEAFARREGEAAGDGTKLR